MFNHVVNAGLARPHTLLLRGIWFAAFLALLNTGCCVNRGGCTSCGDDPWIINDGGMFDPAHGACGECGEVGCGGHRPLDIARKSLTCAAGCSNQVYIDEWISDPPECCDPCNNCGDWVGPRPCGPSLSLGNWRNWFGMRYDGCQSCDSCSGCDAGVGPEMHGYSGQMMEGQMMEGQMMEGQMMEGKMRVIEDKAVPSAGPSSKGKMNPSPPEGEMNRQPSDQGQSGPMMRSTRSVPSRGAKRPFRLLGVQSRR